MISALITIVAAALLVVIDQSIKLWATVNLAPVGSMPLIPGVVELRYYLNDGAAFSILQGKQTFLILFTGAALLVVAWYLLFKKPAKKLEYIGWLFVLGGGIGNLVDRVMNGEVVDYINLLFMNFAVFNFADILVCTGIGLLLLGLVLDEVSARRKKQEEAAPSAADLPEQSDGTV
ncbi:signal peptidase II [Candidatus Allofournierella excrementavium]|uniref:signal peptidase II n=1 Tax=Candidatus Allofournierella excrementavium TaxID=2838591 RepID=UPI003A86C1A3